MNSTINKYRNAAIGICISAALQTLNAQTPVSTPPTDAGRDQSANSQVDTRDFAIGVYINGHQHAPNLPIGRMLADLASVGFTEVVIPAFLYNQFAPMGINRLAADWGMRVSISNLFQPGLTHPESLKPTGANRETVASQEMALAKADFESLKKYVDSLDHSSAVGGWYAGDEVELAMKPKSLPDAEKVLRQCVDMIRAVDPSRVIIVNHDRRHADWGSRFFALGSDEMWCSVFFHNSFAEKALKKTLAEMNAANPKAKKYFVFGAQGVSGMESEEMLAEYGMPDLPLGEAKRRTVSQDISDYLLTSYKIGTDGAALFCYDGYYDYTYYTLVDERGQWKDGKMDAVLSAAKKISAMQGKPKVVLKVQHGTDRGLPKTLEIEAYGVPPKENETITHLTLESSLDGGYTWNAIPGIDATGGKVTYSFLPDGWARANFVMVRARAAVGERKSIWSVWNSHPTGPVSVGL